MAYKPIVNFVDMIAHSKKALVMKDMGNGHTRPFMFGSCVTMVSGTSEVVVASGTMLGTSASDGVYTFSPTVDTIADFYLDKLAGVVKIAAHSGNVASDVTFDVLCIFSTAVDMEDIDAYAGRSYGVKFPLT